MYVETGFNNLSSHNINQVGVFCRWTKNGWYEFNLLSGGMWYIYKYESDSGRYILLKEGGIANFDYVAFHSVGAECIKDNLSFYLDGDLINNATVTDNTIREGQVGVSVFAANK